MRGRAIAAAGLSALVLAQSVPAYAHNKIVHQDLTDLAYEVMLAVQKKQGSSGCPLTMPGSTQCAFDPPPGTDAAAWNKFLTEVAAAVPKLRGLPASLPPPHKNFCGNGGLPSLSPTWADGKALGALEHAPDTDYIVGSDCGIRTGWKPPGVFEEINTASPTRDRTGVALGFWAASIDDEFDDAHLEIRPSNALGTGAVKDVLSDLWNAGLFAIFVPFVCLFDCIFGDCDECADAAQDLAQGTNPIDNLEALLPGFGDFSGGTYTGLWHFINVRPGASNQYDDRQGMLYEEAGPFGVPDAVEVVLMALADASGLSVNYEDSTGPKRYQIQGAGDGHPNTSPIRGEGAWQSTTLGHVEFEPVDNLAFYGWRNFKQDETHSSRWLGWPLHALADATVPMHVTGTSGWGHRPYEDAQQHLWNRLIELDGTHPETLTPTVRRQQFQLVRGILSTAFAWRTFIQARRKALGSQDVPIRDLVTQLARVTFDHATGKQPLTGWPYHPLASGTYLVDEGTANGIYEDRADAVTLGQPLVVHGVAATLAFLMSAMEVI